MFLSNIKLIQVRKTTSLDDYASFASLTRAAQKLRTEASMFVPEPKGRSALKVNSSAQGEGAKMLDEMLQQPQALEHWGRNAQLHVHMEFLF